ncbi:MAG: amidase [Dehalococcoidia bacterium]|nr:amidase [Dehalococcoidia bacterium]
MPLSDDLCALPLHRLAALLRAGELSPSEVVVAHLARIDALNPELNALVQRSDHVLEDARRLETLSPEEREGMPLYGIPFTAKDWIETHDLVCAAGVPERANYVPKRDATVVTRLRAAGAILLGKSNVGDGAPVYPAPRHPTHPNRTPGASSSGDAVAVASGMSPLGLASDSGGSIRWPAHCCGVFALKPTTGLVPNTGHFPRIGHLSDPRTTIGPMARSACDLALALEVIAGPDGVDPGVAPVPLQNPETVDLRRLRVGWYVAFPGAEPDAATVATLEAAARDLAAAGAHVSEVAPPRLEEASAITEGYWARLQSTSFSGWRPAFAPTRDAEAVDRLLFEWERFTRDLLGFMRDFDVLLSPVAARPAPPLEGWGSEQYVYTLPYSLTRQPAAVVPFGRSSEGLPIGVQLAARPWEDHVALAAAIALEDALG